MTAEPAGDIATAWSTPVMVGRLADAEGYNSELRGFILAERERRAHLGVGTVDAAKTSADLLRSSDPVVEPLRALILDVAEAMNERCAVSAATGGRVPEMIAEAWAVVYDDRGYHKLHAHHDSAWSGVYYVHTGAIVPGSGLIELLDPRPACAAAEPWRSPLLPIAPEPGMVLAFPSWLQHWVTPYEGDDQRICVAFNVGFVR